MISPRRSFFCGLLSVTSVAGLILVAGCGDTVINVPTAPTPTPTPTVVKNTIQFRVIGNPIAVRVRYSTPNDGLGQDVTSLPFFSTFTTSASSVFLSLEATPTAYPGTVMFPFLNVQIVVNDVVFKEASAQDFSLQTLSVAGTWRQ